MWLSTIDIHIFYLLTDIFIKYHSFVDLNLLEQR